MDLKKTDPEFAEIFERFVNEEVGKEQGQTLDDITRYLVVLATLIGCQGIQAYGEYLEEVLDKGMDPIMIKECVYQAVDYLGYGRMLPFLTTTNQIFQQKNIPLPLESQSTTNLENRLKKGIEKQVEIFGQQMNEAWKLNHINHWLADNCFGDFYTRYGLNLAQREMITFCFLAAQGDCQPQLIAHIKGNINLGNDCDFLIRVVSQCLPYIGYPRSLNAIACINKVREQEKKDD